MVITFSKDHFFCLIGTLVFIGAMMLVMGGQAWPSRAQTSADPADVFPERADCQLLRGEIQSVQPTTNTYIYTIGSGDILLFIADCFNDTVAGIRERNDITNQDIIYPGDNIRVVDSSGSVESIVPTVNNMPAPSAPTRQATPDVTLTEVQLQLTSNAAVNATLTALAPTATPTPTPTLTPTLTDLPTLTPQPVCPPITPLEAPEQALFASDFITAPPGPETTPEAEAPQWRVPDDLVRENDGLSLFADPTGEEERRLLTLSGLGATGFEAELVARLRGVPNESVALVLAVGTFGEDEAYHYIALTDTFVEVYTFNGRRSRFVTSSRTPATTAFYQCAQIVRLTYRMAETGENGRLEVYVNDDLVVFTQVMHLGLELGIGGEFWQGQPGDAVRLESLQVLPLDTSS